MMFGAALLNAFAMAFNVAVYVATGAALNLGCAIFSASVFVLVLAGLAND